MSDCAYCVANYLVNMIVLKKNSRVKSWISDGSRKAKSWFFYAGQKLPPPLRAGSKVMQKTADILLSRQMSAQKAKWMWHGRGNIYNTHRGGFTCQSFSETSGSTFSHVPIPGAQFVEQPTDAEITFFSKKDSSTPQKTPRSQIVPITVKLELKAT